MRHSFSSSTLFHSERPKLHTIFAFLSAIGLRCRNSVIVIIATFKVAVFAERKTFAPQTKKLFSLELTHLEANKSSQNLFPLLNLK